MWLGCAMLLLLQQHSIIPSVVPQTYAMCVGDEDCNDSFDTTSDSSYASSAAADPEVLQLSRETQDRLQEAQVALNASKALWLAEGIEDYSYTFTETCECLNGDEPFEVNVANQKWVKDKKVRYPPGLELPTVPELFDKIQSSITDAVDNSNADVTIDVIYDEDYGYPTSIYIDQDPTMSDEEYIVAIEDLEIHRLVANPAVEDTSTEPPTEPPTPPKKHFSAQTQIQTSKRPPIRKRMKLFFSLFHTLFN